MTLPASGSLTFAAINSELRTAGGTLVFPDARTRWLAEVPSGNMVIPTDFYSKSAVKIIATTEDTTSRSGSYTFSGASFGTDYTGRTIIVVAHLHASGNVVLNQTGVTVAGGAAVGGDTGENTPSVGSAGVGIWAAQPSGTSGDIVVSFTSGTATGCSITVLSAAGLTSTTAHDTLSLNGGGSGDDAASGTIAVPANGVLIVGVARESTSAMTFTGATEALDAVFDTTGRKGVAFSNALSVDAARAVGFTSSGIVGSGLRAHSYA